LGRVDRSRLVAHRGESVCDLAFIGGIHCPVNNPTGLIDGFVSEETHGIDY